MLCQQRPQYRTHFLHERPLSTKKNCPFQYSQRHQSLIFFSLHLDEKKSCINF